MYSTWVVILVVCVSGSCFALESVAMPSLVEFGKIYGTGGGMTDDNVVGYSAMVATNGARMNVSWARAVPTPRSEHYTYQPLAGEKSGTETSTDYDQETDVFETNLNFNRTEYNDLNKVKFVLRLSVDSERGPVDVYVFLHNDDLYEQMSFARVELPETATHIVPDQRAGGNVSHEVQITVPNLELDVRPSYARVFQQHHEQSDMARPRDYWVVLPKNHESDQRKYSEETTQRDGSTVVKQSFLAADAYISNAGLYQFDTVVVSQRGPLYHISIPFLLRQQNYTHHYQGILPCSPYRRDMSGKWLPQLGVVEGDLPCARFVLVSDHYAKAWVRFNFINRDPYTKLQQNALVNDRTGLNVVKDRYYVISDVQRYEPLFDKNNEYKNNVALVHDERTGSVGHRQTNFRFMPYKPIEYFNTSAVEYHDWADKVRYTCSATWARYIKILRVTDRFYRQLAMDNAARRDDMKYMGSIRYNYKMGIESVQREGGDRGGTNVNSVIVRFHRNKMPRLFEGGMVIICVAYNEMDLRLGLLTDDYPVLA